MLGPILLLLPMVWSACPDHPSPANGKLVASPWQENTLAIRWNKQTNFLKNKQRKIHINKQPLAGGHAGHQVEQANKNENNDTHPLVIF